MTPFEHLSVLISIILGLGIAQLLTNVHGLAQASGRVRIYWLSVLWTILIFVAQVEECDLRAYYYRTRRWSRWA